MPGKKTSNRKSREQRVTRVRNSILGGVAAIAIAVGGYGLVYSSGATEGEFVEGNHYQLLDNPSRRRAGDPITVEEFFSYTCIHCKNFDPLIEKWQLAQSDAVSFSRSPVVFAANWATLGKTYHAMDQLGILDPNHDRLFRQIHDNRQNFGTADEVAEFIDGKGATKQEFLKAFNSSEVRRALGESDAGQRTNSILTVPTLIVACKYSITLNDSVGRKTAIDVLDHLIALEQEQLP